jgi:FAD/FMN-containing dehydrogenase
VNAIHRENKALIAERFPKLNRSLTGYDLAHIRDRKGRFDLNAILCGAEGTLGFIAEAELNVLPIPEHSALINIRYDSFDAALRDARPGRCAGGLDRDRRLEGAGARPQGHRLARGAGIFPR